MNSVELTTAEELVREHAPELIPGIDGYGRFDAQLSALVFSQISAFLVIFYTLGDNLVQPLSLIVSGVFAVAGAVVGEWALRRFHQKTQARFFRNLKDAPWKVYEAVAVKFAGEIARQRARTLGPDSEWGKSRRPLEGATQEAARSTAYWQQRLAMDPANQVIRQQLETAQQLHDKFQKALNELDARSQVLVSFFNECDARLAVLLHTKRDFEEVQRLGALSERADVLVDDARKTLLAIGSGFLNEAFRVARALGGLERYGILSSAEAVPVDKIETLADRILESSEREMSALESLTRGVSA